MYTHPMKLDDTLGHDLDLPGLNGIPADAFGVEVELEGSNLKTLDKVINEMWAIHPDHSLRAHAGDCCEYVFAKPYDFENSKKAIDALFDYLNGGICKVADSYRTSIHVHLNFAKETYRTIFNFITLCFIFDELLVSQNGHHRIGNNFCLRARDAEGQVTALIDSVQNGHMFFNIGKNERYSSINFVSLMKFATVEFRSLECTTHKGRLMHWINTLARLKEFSKTFENPQKIIEKFSGIGPQMFLSMALGPYALKYVQVAGFDDMLHHGMRLAQDFAYCSAWNLYDQKAAVEKHNKQMGELGHKPMKIKKLNGGGWNVDFEALNPLGGPPQQNAVINGWGEPEQ